MDDDGIEWIRDDAPTIVAQPPPVNQAPPPDMPRLVDSFLPPTLEEWEAQQKNGGISVQFISNTSAAKTFEPEPSAEINEERRKSADIPVENLNISEEQAPEPAPLTSRHQSDDIEWIRDDETVVERKTSADIPVKICEEKKVEPSVPPPRPKTPDYIEYTIKPSTELNKKSEERETIPDVTDDEGVSQQFDLDGYEKQLAASSAETQHLLDDMGTKADRIRENNMAVADGLAAQRDFLNKSFKEEPHKTIQDEVQVPTRSELPAGSLPRNVDSIIIGEGQLESIAGMVLLPNATMLVADGDFLVLFDLVGNLLTKTRKPEWSKVRSPIYHKEHILILADWTADGQTKRHIVKLTLDLQYVARIEGPKWLEDKFVVKDTISIAHTDFIYLAASGEISSMLFELSPEGMWTELEFKQSEHFTNICAFATIGSITQLLVLESVRNYVYQVSVRESQIVDRRKMAICERPGAMAKDESGRLFIVNKSSACVQLVDTIQWVSSKSIAVIEGAAPWLAASWGLLAIPAKDYIRLQRYSFR